MTDSETVAITGASGLIGRALEAALTADGTPVRRLARPWDPAAGEFDPGTLDGVRTVVHLAGENIGRRRWSEDQKRRIVDSRVRGTAVLARAIVAAERPPALWISGSAIGYYGDRGAEPVDETAGAGEGFLADTAIAWEAATDPAQQAGVRVVKLRTGVVLSPKGGALARMLLPFRLGLGGRIGDGSQFMSWIGLDDLVGVIRFAMRTEAVRGPVNAVAPNAVTNREFTAALARVLRRPALLPLPAVAVRVLLGEMGRALLLEGARVEPRVLLDQGYRFAHPDLDSCLRHELRGV